jgi:hypothetical protein
MKKNAHPYSRQKADLLKVVQQQAPVLKINSHLTPYLKRILSGDKKPAKIYSLKSINEMVANVVKPFISKVPTDIELSERNWYTNYE